MYIKGNIARRLYRRRHAGWAGSSSIRSEAQVGTIHCVASNTSCPRDEMWSAMSSARVRPSVMRGDAHMHRTGLSLAFTGQIDIHSAHFIFHRAGQGVT